MTQRSTSFNDFAIVTIGRNDCKINCCLQLKTRQWRQRKMIMEKLLVITVKTVNTSKTITEQQRYHEKEREKRKI